jgi:DNA-binding NarL/FixJ family response regulator
LSPVANPATELAGIFALGGASMPLTETTVLIVEDNWLVAISVADACRNAGAKVVGPASSVAETFEFLASERVDVAILDFRMSCGTASPIAHDLQERALPFLFYTGSPEAAIAHPGVHVLLKPCSSAQIVEALKTVVSRHRYNSAIVRFYGENQN